MVKVKQLINYDAFSRKSNLKSNPEILFQHKN